MAATAITPVDLNWNAVENTKIKLVPSTDTGTTFAIATSKLGDYSKVVIGMIPGGGAEKLKLTVYGSDDFAGSKNENYVKEFYEGGGSTQGYCWAGPFDSALFKSTNGLKFNISPSTATGSTAKCSHVFALGLPGYK
jgi:hypothetical protein